MSKAKEHSNLLVETQKQGVSILTPYAMAGPQETQLPAEVAGLQGPLIRPRLGKPLPGTSPRALKTALQITLGYTGDTVSRKVGGNGTAAGSIDFKLAINIKYIF